jgi:hypothetical protein
MALAFAVDAEEITGLAIEIRVCPNPGSISENIPARR